MTTKLNAGFFGTITAVIFNQDNQTIEVIMTQNNGTSRLMRHKVGARDGISKQASANLWKQLHVAMDDKSVVVFHHRGNWKQWFDAVTLKEEKVIEEASFEQIIGLTA
jgi:ABC-type uncharacterized transport system permease subunit